MRCCTVSAFLFHSCFLPPVAPMGSEPHGPCSHLDRGAFGALVGDVRTRGRVMEEVLLSVCM